MKKVDIRRQEGVVSGSLAATANGIDGWVKQRAFVSHTLGGRSPRSRCQTVWFLEDPLPSLQTAAFSLCTHRGGVIRREEAVCCLC